MGAIRLAVISRWVMAGRVPNSKVWQRCHQPYKYWSLKEPRFDLNGPCNERDAGFTENWNQSKWFVTQPDPLTPYPRTGGLIRAEGEFKDGSVFWHQWFFFYVNVYLTPLLHAGFIWGGGIIPVDSAHSFKAWFSRLLTPLALQPEQILVLQNKRSPLQSVLHYFLLISDLEKSQRLFPEISKPFYDGVRLG